jgi:NADPH-dependent curcumin reductase CurA
MCGVQYLLPPSYRAKPLATNGKPAARRSGILGSHVVIVPFSCFSCGMKNRYWTPSGKPVPNWPEADTFTLHTGDIPKPADGQALTRTIYISLDPYQWGYKRRKVEPEGVPCHARTVSQVIESRMPGLAAGDYVFNTNGWAEYGLMGEGVWRPAYMVPRKLDPAIGRISLGVGVLGMLGLTAYAGLIVLADPKRGETVVVSAASGGVGQIVGQLARLKGCRVVGIAGKESKCKFVTGELRFDACVSHLSPTFADDLKRACPNGVDVYFENVGGPVFEAVLPLFNGPASSSEAVGQKRAARMTICGLIAHYGDAPGTDARASLMAKGERIFKERGMTVNDLFVGDFVTSHQDAMLAELAPAVKRGDVLYCEDIRQGIENIPTYFSEMLKGDNFGKMLVQVGEDKSA